MKNLSSQKKLIRITTIPMALHVLLTGQMKFMSENGFEVIMISADGENLDKVIQNEKCRHIIVPMTRQITPLQDLKCLVKLIMIFRKEKPDIVHSHTPKAGLLAMIAAKLTGVKIRIHTVAGLPMVVEKGLKKLLLKNIEKMTFTFANHVWPNSNSLLQFIKENKLTSVNKLKVIAKGSSNGIDLNKFDVTTLNPILLEEIKSSINYSVENTYLLCMGRLVKDKGLSELVNVFISLQEQFPFLRLMLIGDFEESLDPLPKIILEEIKNNSSIIHVKWTDKVEYYLSLANIFVFPSHREGFPNVLLQAGAMSLPIICSNIMGNIDIVKDNETGLIFKCKNEIELNNKILQALSEPKHIEKMTNNLHQIITSSYRREMFWQTMLLEYLKLFKQINKKQE